MSAASACYFVPYEELGDIPNIVVDGAASSATAITLSHWPKSGTPHPLKADTSAEIVFIYLDASEFHVDANAVSNNHFDEDGLIGLFTLIEPDAAIRMRDLLIDAAHAGDFAAYQDRRAARVAFTVSSFADPDTSPLDPMIFDMPYAEQCAALYQEILPCVGEIAADTEHFKNYWEREDRILDESEQAIRDGQVTIREIPDVDLAVVAVPETQAPSTVHRFTWASKAHCHPMAIHNATRCNRILNMQGRQYSFLYRYESWVQYMTVAIPPRIDLTPLAEELTSDEPGDAVWTFEGVSEITPALTLSDGNDSAIAPENFQARLIAFLESAPAAWDPYDPA